MQRITPILSLRSNKFQWHFKQNLSNIEGADQTQWNKRGLKNGPDHKKLGLLYNEKQCA